MALQGAGATEPPYGPHEKVICMCTYVCINIPYICAYI